MRCFILFAFFPNLSARQSLQINSLQSESRPAAAATAANPDPASPAQLNATGTMLTPEGRNRVVRRDRPQAEEETRCSHATRTVRAIS